MFRMETPCPFRLPDGPLVTIKISSRLPRAQNFPNQDSDFLPSSPLSSTHIETRKMSQKREKEETLELKVTTETLTLCPENCKISSNSATNTATMTSRSQVCVGSTSDRTRIGGSSTNEAGSGSGDPPGKQVVVADGEGRKAAVKNTANRCCGCGKRVGLTGFRCRCGELFCGEHRYSDRHDCSFDYKAAGREAIAKENPVVRAAKILKV